MKNISLVKFSFKPNMKNNWLDWCEELKNRSDEVYATLSNEGAKIEACFISEKEDACYYLMCADDVGKALELSEKSELPIDREHREVFQKSLAYIEKCKPLFFFERDV